MIQAPLSEISVTELQTWLRCRRQWDLVSHNRQALQPVGGVALHFTVGTAMHLAFAAQAAGYDPLDVVARWFVLQNDPRLEEVTESSLAMIKHYFTYWGWDNPLERQGLRYVCTEVPLKVPIPDSEGCGENGCDDPLYLVGTIDGIAEDEGGNFWIVEHKTYHAKPDMQYMKINFQMTAYAWMFREVFGIEVLGAVYDGVAKKLPGVPSVLKNGTMSRAWIDTTAGVYLEALLEAGLDPNDYADFLSRLAERDGAEENAFFTRRMITIPNASANNFESALAVMGYDMWRAHQSLPSQQVANSGMRDVLFPTPRWDGCWDCNVVKLCQAIQLGDDVQYAIDNYYERSRGYQTIGASKIERDMLQSVHELEGRTPNILREMVEKGVITMV